MPSQFGSMALKGIGGAVIVALSFSITTILLTRLDGSDRVTVLPAGQVIQCSVTLTSILPEGGQSWPIVTVGQTNAADIVYMVNKGKQVVIGLDDWGHANKTTTVDADNLKNATLTISFDYSHNVVSVAMGGSEILRNAGTISAKFTGQKIFIGQNPIGYPGFAPSFPDIIQQAQAGAATCVAHDTPAAP